MSDSDDSISEDTDNTNSTTALRNNLEGKSVKHGQIGWATVRVVEYDLIWPSADEIDCWIEEERRARNLRIEFPDSVWELNHITKLSITDSPHSEIPSGIGKLTNLTELLIQDCEFTRLPDSIERLTNLEILKIRECKKLLSLSTKMDGLKNLKELWLSDTGIKCLPPEVRGLKKLKKIDLKHNNEMKSLPTEIINLEGLEKISLYWHEQLIVPSETFLIPSLKILELDHCKDINFPKEKQSPIQELEITGMDFLSTLPDNFPTIMSNLKTLKICRCPNPRFPLFFKNLSKITTLYIKSKSISLINNLPCLPNLKSMCLRVYSQQNEYVSPPINLICSEHSYDYLPLKIFDDDAWKDNVSLEELTIHCGGSFIIAEDIFRGLPRTLRKLELDTFSPKRRDGLISENLPPGLMTLRLFGDVFRKMPDEEKLGCFRSLFKRYDQLVDVRLHRTKCGDLPFYETYLWKFNQCGRVLLKGDMGGNCSNYDQPTGIPSSLWPTVLARVDRMNRTVKNESWRGQLNASIIFQLLHGTAFLRRADMGNLAKTSSSSGNDDNLQASTGPSLSNRKRKAEKMDIPN